MVETNPLLALLIAPLFVVVGVFGWRAGTRIIRDGVVYTFDRGRRYPRWYELLAGWTLRLTAPLMVAMGILGAVLSAGNL